MTPCLTPAELLLCLTPDPSRADTDNASHARKCQVCRTRLEALRRTLSGTTETAPDCLDEFALAEVVGAVNDDAIDPGYRAHVAGCAACRRELEELISVVRDPAVRAELDRPEWSLTRAPVPTRRRPVRVMIGGLAAAAAVLLAARLFLPRHAPAATNTYRHATIAAAAAPRLLSPVGSVALLDTLSWTSVPNADRYRVSIFDSSGSIAWEDEVTDTFLVIPRESTARWAGAYRWRVKARTSFDRWVDSDFGEFNLSGSNR